MKLITTITEQCGARWRVYVTGATGERAYDVRWMSGSSVAQPSIIAFYASSIIAACDALNN